jgi:hypothetical protein
MILKKASKKRCFIGRSKNLWNQLKSTIRATLKSVRIAVTRNLPKTPLTRNDWRANGYNQKEKTNYGNHWNLDYHSCGLEAMWRWRICQLAHYRIAVHMVLYVPWTLGYDVLHIPCRNLRCTQAYL